MTPFRGRAARGERVIEAVPFGHWQTSTLIQAIDHQQVVASLVLEGASNTQVFETFVEQVLLPELRPGDLVILDNLASHKSIRTEELIRAAGAELRFLPPYSPDLNPIEKIFSKLKTCLRKAQARTRNTLWDAIAAAIQTITPSDCQNCLTACGYRNT
jgi:putative transposase